MWIRLLWNAAIIQISSWLFKKQNKVTGILKTYTNTQISKQRVLIKINESGHSFVVAIGGRKLMYYLPPQFDPSKPLFYNTLAMFPLDQPPDNLKLPDGYKAQFLTVIFK